MTSGVPRPLLAVGVVVLAVTTVMVFVGGWRTGVSWDETYHVLRMRNYLGPGWYLLNGDLLDGEPGPWEDQQFVYAPITMGLLHLWSLGAGTDGSGEVSATATAYAVRHLGLGLLSLGCLASVAALARLALHRWSWGLMAAAMLAAMPAWTGHAMFNVKDVPVATGYTLTTLGLAVVVMATDRRHTVVGAATLVAGIVLAAGTRPGIWPGLALAALVAAAFLPRARRLPGVLVIGAALAVAVGIVALVYPAPFATPVDALFGSVLESSRFGDRSVSRWYIPVFLLAEVPTLLLLLGGLGTVVVVRRLWRGRQTGDTRRAVLALVLLQAFTLPVLSIVRGSNLYNGLRQLLFAYPALAVLATVGAAVLLGAVTGERRTWLRVSVPLLVGAAVVVPVVVQAQVFPYNYTVRTVPAMLLAPTVAEHWSDFELPTDYWRTSVRELAPEVPQGGWVTCQPNGAGDDFMRWSNDGHEDCTTDPIGPLAPYDDLRSGTWAAPETEFLAVMSGVDRIGANCTRFADVTRRMWWRTMTMSYAATCDLVTTGYPAGGLTFTSDGNGGSALLGGWSGGHVEPGVGLSRESAEIGFTLPAWARGEDLVVVLDVEGGHGVTLDVDGESVPVTGDDATLRAAVPAGLAARDGEGRLLVRVRDADHDVRVLGLRLEEGGVR
ncbi:hypothetical protein ASC77_03675 [Nocardioides sp. Root1257]|uniref:hypothetical protein n=1 Tax=Nocardioides sp. Root224 TaxID=1736495 RepID=UPI0006FBDB40|nr:hypothetical protein [Nocardioides sp. Root224]KQW53393.1 hypothetical protein ASC77_03675 [Nocardioides sp. Root1257]KRC56079.1 hypothetical protein ASE24_03675 [Nocardioides sp. Root224]